MTQLEKIKRINGKEINEDFLKPIKIHEIQSLQNFANKFGLTVKEYFDNDKRKKKKYLLIKEGIAVSNAFTYEEMNIFLIGVLRCKEFNL